QLNPYLIAHADHLYNVRNHLDKHFRQIADVDLSDYKTGEGWNPIGTTSNSFIGTYDGDGFTVRNLFINKVGAWNVRVPSGLFGYTVAGAEIRNLKLESVDITGCYYVGSIVGSNSGKITGVISSGTVTGEFDTGGLVGVSGKTGSITDSSFTGTVTGTDVIEYGEWTGGLVGYNNGSITNCQADVTVVSVYRTIGGLVGENLEDGIITGSSSTGSVTAGNYTGGLIGCNSGEITRCHSSSTVNGDSNVGGLVGNNGGPITESYSTGNVTGSSSDVGGLVGYNGETITSSYSTGTVTGYSNVGGLVGRNDDPITGSYSVGSVTGNNSKGGLVGYDLYRKATDCYWDKETSGIGYSCGGTGKTTAEMKQQPTFINWDFTATWNINDSMNNGYPFLRWHSSVATPTTPSAPQNFSATPGDTQVALSWEAPASDGGSAITNYQVSNDNGTNWTDVALSTTHTFTGLTNGTPYTFKVRAVNSVGNSTEASATTTPQAEVCEINGIKYATLEQALAVVTDGQTIKLLTHITHTSPIVVDTETIYFDLGNYNLLVDTSTDPDNTIRHVVSAINGGKLRLNGTGTGTFNVKSTSYSIGVRVIGAYSEVTVDNVDVTRAGATGVYMYGSGPNLDGGKVTVNGHINAGNTAISVNAKNGIITVNGDITAAHTGVTTSTNAGTSVTVNGNINVLGSEPQHVGGYGIMASGLTSVKVTGNVTSQGTDYVGVYAYGGGIEVGGNVVSSGTGAKAYPNSSYGKGNVTIDGSLSAGTPFVVVGNIVKTPDQITEPTTKPGLLTYTDGASNVWIGSVGSIATTAPTIPQSFNATAGDGQIALNWAAPSSNGGSAITKYQVSKDNGTSWTDVGLNTTYTFTGLTNGTEYTFKVRAVNSVGNGAEASVSATPTATSIFYAVSVNNGTGGGNYEQGVPVTITANTAPSGQQFKEWITTPLVTFIDSTSATDATAKFTMPEQAVTATAVYESIPTTVMSVTVNPSSVTAQKGETHQFSAIVNGVNNPSQNVTWTVHGASSETIITTSGALTIAVSETAATLTVTATSSADPSKSGTSTVTVTQPVQPTIYTVTFNENGGYVSPVTMQTGADGKLTGLPTPSRDGYTFDGWYTATDGGTTISTNTIFTANTIIYAHWAQDSGGSIVLIIPTTPVNRAKAKRGDGSEAMLPVIVDEDAGSASVHLGSRGLDQQGTVITIPSIPSVNTYSVGIPVPDLSTTSFQGTLTVNTDKGNVTAPSNMLNGTGIKGSHAVISIGRGNKDNLPDSVKSAIGNRPLIQLTLSIDGKQTNWSNPNAPVTVSIPYAPTATELQNPESIVVWYIDGSGIVVTVPNGHYDPTTGMVTFDITHFSNYAVVYNRMSFKDVAFDAWYSKAVSFIAARRITLGTGNEDFSPNVKLTRGEFIVLLMRAYDIAPDTIPIDNFYDAANTYYTGYLAAAKRFGITVGVGGNMYAPNKEITRQEMFTMLYNVLNVVGQRPQGDSGKTLSDF
ncbi:MAG TPA: hypothetical protein DDZ89_21025, partial [Clostridiales bacterium]|nr:hypothetical protein [Clostridiales bacterium]